MQTPSATIGIRGGLILVDLTPDGQLQVIFGYGVGVTVTGLNGVAQAITRGFQVTVAGLGAAPSTASPAPPGASAALLAQLDRRPGGNGARTIPTDATVGNSGFLRRFQRSQLCKRNRHRGWRTPFSKPRRRFRSVPTAQLFSRALRGPKLELRRLRRQHRYMPVTQPMPAPVVISYAGNFKSTNGQGTARGLLDPGGPAASASAIRAGP